jgi:rhodanese-related sulfurtransferase
MKRWQSLFLLPVLLGLALQVCAQDLIYIDVRSPQEFAEGHVEGALNMPHEQIVALVAKAGLAKDSPVALYCRSGRRSGLALEALQEAGYSNAKNVGGYEALAAALKKDACQAESC